MTGKLRWLLLATLATLAACVTINVYFPAAEAQQAAREFVDDVIGRPDAGNGNGNGNGKNLIQDCLQHTSVFWTHEEVTMIFALIDDQRKLYDDFQTARRWKK